MLGLFYVLHTFLLVYVIHGIYYEIHIAIQIVWDLKLSLILRGQWQGQGKDQAFKTHLNYVEKNLVTTPPTHTHTQFNKTLMENQSIVEVITRIT